MMNGYGNYADTDLITPEQSREISMMALQKGAALQRLVNVTSKNTSSVKAMKNALFMLKVYAFGEEHKPTMNSIEQKGSFRFSQVQLKLLRQEQLMLLSENQRLVEELQKIRKLNFSNFSPQATQPAQKHTNVKNSKLVKSIEKTLLGENEVNLVRSKLLYLVATIDRVRYRILSCSLRRIASCNGSGGSGPVNYVNPHKYYTLTKKAACILLENVLQEKVRSQKLATLFFMKNFHSTFTLHYIHQHKPLTPFQNALPQRSIIHTIQNQVPYLHRYYAHTHIAQYIT